MFDINVAIDNWQEWTAREWNDAIFRYYFLEDGRSGPVTRLPVTGEELQKVAGDQGADPTHIREAFLSAIRVSPREINRRALSAGWLKKGEWVDSIPPPFVVYLVFTCLVASAIGEEIRDEGEFRERLRILLDHPSGTSYPLEDLPKLWEAFARWLNRSREAGSPVRQLVLPDPGRMNRIGYSVRLAFPGRRDQLKLAKLLAPYDLGSNPPVPIVLRLVESRLGSFSESFRQAFTKFRSAFVRSDSRLNEYPFWSAVREAATTPVSDGAPRRSTFQLLIESTDEWRDELLLMTDIKPEQNLKGVHYVPVEIGLGKYDHVVAVEGKNDQVDHAVRLLLHRVLDRVVPDIRSSSVHVVVEQGVLLFYRDDSGVRALTSSRPDDEDEVWAIIREDLKDSFLAIFPTDQRPAVHQSPYSEWVATSAFDGALLRRFDHTRPGPLHGVRCLQPTAIEVHLSLAGGVPLKGAYLGLPLCYPTVRVRDADSVILFALGEGSVVGGTMERLRLRPSAESEESFEFPTDRDLVLDGRFNLIAKEGPRVVAQRQITFRSAMIWNGFSRPADSGRWLAESTTSDLVVPDVDAEAPEIAAEPSRSEVRHLAAERRRNDSREASQGRMLDRLDIPEGDLVPIAYDQTYDDELRLDRFIECCAGWAASRKGITEFDFLEWIRRGLSIESSALRFDVARAWTEGGHFDQYTQRRWRGRIYFARNPELVAWRTGSQVFCTLRGLAARAVRNQVQASAEANGVQRRPTVSLSPWLPAPHSWMGESIKIFERISAEAGLGPVRWLQSPSDFIVSVAAVATLDLDEPMHYIMKGTLDWDQGWFTPGTARERNSVKVQRLWRSDRPAYYTVLWRDRMFWLSHSRNWALLAAYTLAGIAPFERTGSTELVRTAPTQVYLPLPVARFLACTAAYSPGPARVSEQEWTYAYSFQSKVERDQVLALLWGEDDRGIEFLARRARWLLAVIRDHERTAGRTPLVPVPADIRRDLSELGIPEARELASMVVPVYMIPHLRCFTVLDQA